MTHRSVFVCKLFFHITNKVNQGLGIDLACMTLLKMGAKAPDMPRGHKLSKNPGLQEHISQLSVTDRLSSAIDELSNRAAVLDNRGGFICHFQFRASSLYNSP